MEEKTFNATYIVLFCKAKHPPAEFDEDMKIFRLSLQQVAASQAEQDKAPNEFSAFVGFEYGKKRIVAVHILAKNVRLERHVVRSNFFVGDFEYVRFWHERRSALLELRSEEEYEKYLNYIRSISKQTTEWGKANGGVSKN